VIIISNYDGERENNISCWELFGCPENIHKKCKVYLNSIKETSLDGGWLYYDTLVGGPAKRGPCANCEMIRRNYPEFAKLVRD
jgi:hypothetical protein